MAGTVTDLLYRIGNLLAGTLAVSAIAPISYTEAQLTAPAQTTTARSFSGFSRLTAQLLVATINTNVVIRLEGSNDGTNWFNLNSSNFDTTITTNGVQAFTWQGIASQVRANFISESGGITATLDFVMRFGA